MIVNECEENGAGRKVKFEVRQIFLAAGNNLLSMLTEIFSFYSESGPKPKMKIDKASQKGVLLSKLWHSEANYTLLVVMIERCFYKFMKWTLSEDYLDKLGGGIYFLILGIGNVVCRQIWTDCVFMQSILDFDRILYFFLDVMRICISLDLMYMLNLLKVQNC